MTDAAALITQLGNEGATAASIADELNRRGLRARNKLPFSAEVVAGFLRVLGIGPTLAPRTEAEQVPPAVLPSSEALKKLENEAYEAAEPFPAEPPPHSKDGTMQYAPTYRPDVLRPWPMHTDFRPDELPAGERWD